MKIKRITSLLLALVMALGVLAGCGDKNNSGGQSDGEVTLTVGIPQNANVSDYEDNAFTKYLEEQSGVKLKFVFFSGAEYRQQLALMCSAKETLPDVLLGFGFSQYEANQYGEDGYFLDLTDLIEQHAPNYKAQLENLDAETKDYVLNKGKSMNTGAYYGMPRVLCEAWDDLQSVMYINKNWLDKLGLEIPTTTDELKAVLEAFATRDPNGNGQADELAMVGAQNMICYLLNGFVSYRAGTYNVTDGKVWDPVKTDEFRQGLIYGNELVSAGLYSKLSFSFKRTSEYKAVISPVDGPSKVGVFAGNHEVFTNAATNALEEFVALPALADATGRGGYTIVNDPVIDWCGFITKDCRNPEAAMRLLDLFYLDETISRQRHGEKDVDWEYEEGLNALGEPGYVNPINMEAFFSGNSTWCLNACGIMTRWNYIVTSSNDLTPRAKESNRLAAEQWGMIADGKKPAENATRLEYTEEEYAAREAKASSMLSYISEQTVLFVTGEKDPRDDGAWNDFLSTLDQLGRVELMDICQRAYDRKAG